MVITTLPALLASVLLAAFAFWIYLRRELPISGRLALAALRAGALVLLVLLLWNPSLPARSRPGGEVQPWVALDDSRSMTASGGEDAPWSRALARARTAAAAGARVVTLGESRGPVPDLDSLTADAETSLLAPTLRRAAEAGVRELTVVSDLRLDDAVAVAAELSVPGLRVRIEDVGGPVVSAGIADVEAPATGRAGEAVRVAVEVFATAESAGDSARLVLTRDGAAVGSWTIELPGPGTTVRREVETSLPREAGTVLWRATVRTPGDAFEDDDGRARATEVDPASGVVAVVSLAPDWESRFLLPVLTQVTGLPTRGWLRVGPDRYLPTGGGAVVGAEALRPALEEARILVLLGLGRDAPDWVREVLRTNRRTLVLAGDPSGAAAAGVPAGPVRAGEWYATAPVPASPVAAALADLPVAELPPLGRVLPPGGAPAGQAALAVQRAGAGPTVPALVLRDEGRRRTVVALASGFWRWAFRPDAPREAYRRLWSGVAGWLLEFEEGAALAGLAPESPVVSATAPVTWRAPEAGGGRIEVTLARDGATQRTDTISVDATGRGDQPPVPEGSWTWEARVLAPDSVAGRGRTWRGVLESERWTGELRAPRADLAIPDPAAAAGRATAGDGAPLRTRPWPYLLVLGLLSVEWVGRRRSGLR
jgi:hypothetical protein